MIDRLNSLQLFLRLFSFGILLLHFCVRAGVMAGLAKLSPINHCNRAFVFKFPARGIAVKTAILSSEDVKRKGIGSWVKK
jgi:hypothetical protein